MNIRKKAAASVIALATVVAAAGCGGDEGGNASSYPKAGASLSSLEEAASDEGELTVYSNAGDAENWRQLADNFEDKYPDISVEIVQLIDGDMIPKLELEQSSNQPIADLAFLSSWGWVSQKGKEGFFSTPVGPEFEGEGEYDAATYVRDGGAFEIGATLKTFAWNTERLPDGLTGFEDLLSPELADGRIGVIDPSIGSAVVDYYKWLEVNFGAEYVQALADQEPRIYDSGTSLVEAVVSGEVAATPYAATAQVEDAKEAGAPVSYGLGPEGAWGAKFYAFIPKGVEHPNAANLFANYLVTREAQEVVLKAASSVVPGIEGKLMVNADVADADLETQEPDNLEAYVNEWTNQFR